MQSTEETPPDSPDIDNSENSETQVNLSKRFAHILSPVEPRFAHLGETIHNIQLDKTKTIEVV